MIMTQVNPHTANSTFDTHKARRAEARGLPGTLLRNVEMMWLAGRQFVALCRQLELFTEDGVSIDGSKFKAVNAREKNSTRAKMMRRMMEA